MKRIGIVVFMVISSEINWKQVFFCSSKIYVAIRFNAGPFMAKCCPIKICTDEEDEFLNILNYHQSVFKLYLFV